MANDVCGIALTQQQIDDVNELFDAAVVTYLFTTHACDVLNQTTAQTAAAFDAAAAAPDGSALISELARNSARFRFRVPFRVGRLILSGDDIEAPAAAATAAQNLLDEFLSIINDLCGIPSLSDVTLAQLRQNYLEDLLNTAMPSP